MLKTSRTSCSIRCRILHVQCGEADALVCLCRMVHEKGRWRMPLVQSPCPVCLRPDMRRGGKDVAPSASLDPYPGYGSHPG